MARPQHPDPQFKPLLLVLIRCVAAPFTAMAVGSMAAFVESTVEFVIMEWQGGGHLLEVIVGALFAAIFGGIYGGFAGFSAGLFTMPLLFIARRKSVLDVVAMTALAAIVSYLVFDAIERGDGWQPTWRYLTPRVTGASIGVAATVWLFGRSVKG